MGNCNSLNCTAPPIDEPLDADGGIVGLGVLAAFFITALATAIAILWGYFYEALPEDYLSEADRRTIENYKKSRFATKFLPWLERKWEVVKNPISSFSHKGLLSEDQTANTHHSLSREKRTEALTKFILSLSDQQLVTGLAILIGALSNRCRISIYEFRVVVSLAWFSSTTHLATLGVLRSYFVENKVVRNWRVIGMLSLMVLLIFSLIAQTGAADQTTPLQCGFPYLLYFPYSTFNSSTNSSSANPNSTYSDLADSNLGFGPTANGIFFSLGPIILCITVLLTYMMRVTALYRENKPKDSSQPLTRKMTVHSREKIVEGSVLLLKKTIAAYLSNGVNSSFNPLAQVLVRRKLRASYPEFSAGANKDEFRTAWKKLTRSNDGDFSSLAPAENLGRDNLDIASQRMLSVIKNQGAFAYAMFQHRKSFMAEIPHLGFDMAFGLSGVVWSRDSYAPSLGPSSYNMDFGQIVPLFLLALPMLVAAEIYYDSRSEVSKDTSSDSSSSKLSPSQAKPDSISPPEAHRSLQNISSVGHSEQDLPATPPASIKDEDPETNQRIVKMVFWIFAARLLVSIICGSLYNVKSSSWVSTVAAIAYLFLLPALFFILSSSSLPAYVDAVDIPSFYAQILALEEAKAEGDGARLTPELHASRSHSLDDARSSSASMKTKSEGECSTDHGLEPSIRLSDGHESIPIRTFSPVVGQTDSSDMTSASPETSVTTAAVPLTSCSNPATLSPSVHHGISNQPSPPFPRQSSARIPDIQLSISTPTKPQTSPISQIPASDDGRLYNMTPQRQDTEADLGILPLPSPSQEDGAPRIIGEIYPEPEELTKGVASGINTGSDTMPGEGGVRRRGTIEIPGGTAVARERI